LGGKGFHPERSWNEQTRFCGRGRGVKTVKSLGSKQLEVCFEDL